MTIQTDLLHEKISNEDYQRLIVKHSESFSEGEILLLNEILEKFRFDVVQAQALAQASCSRCALIRTTTISTAMMKIQPASVRTASIRPCRPCAIIWFGAKHAAEIFLIYFDKLLTIRYRTRPSGQVSSLHLFRRPFVNKCSRLG